MTDSKRIDSQLDHLDFDFPPVYGPFILKKDYVRHAANLASTIMVQDNVIDILTDQLNHANAKIAKLEARIQMDKNRWHEEE